MRLCVARRARAEMPVEAPSASWDAVDARGGRGGGRGGVRDEAHVSAE